MAALSRDCVCVFLRLPHPGRVKTRLAAAVGNAQAALFYRCCAETVVGQLGRHAAQRSAPLPADPDHRAQTACARMQSLTRCVWAVAVQADGCRHPRVLLSSRGRGAGGSLAAAGMGGEPRCRSSLAGLPYRLSGRAALLGSRLVHAHCKALSIVCMPRPPLAAGQHALGAATRASRPGRSHAACHCLRV